MARALAVSALPGYKRGPTRNRSVAHGWHRVYLPWRVRCLLGQRHRYCPGPALRHLRANRRALQVTTQEGLLGVSVDWDDAAGASEYWVRWRVAASSDLSATSGTVTFPANSAAGATQSITITATDDSREPP